MKKLIVFFCATAFLMATTIVMAESPDMISPPEKVIKIGCSSELKALTEAWTETFRAGHPNIGLSMTSEMSEGLGSWIAQSGNLALLTKTDLEGLDPSSASITVIGREVYVPIINQANPFKEEILMSGLSPNDFASAYGSELSWGDLLNNKSKLPLKAYRVSEAVFSQYLADFLGLAPEAIHGTVLADCDKVINAVQNTQNGIGFCKLSQLEALSKTNQLNGLTMVPLDLNDNGQIDHFEKIYSDVNTLERGIWIGKYTGTLYSRIFAVTGKENTATLNELLSWLSTEGQTLMAEHGFSPLLETEQAAILASLENKAEVNETNEVQSNNASAALIILALITGGAILSFIVLRIFDSKKEADILLANTGYSAKKERPNTVPGGYFFDRSHSWTFLEKDGNIRIGIDNFLQNTIGSITRVEMKSPGERIKKGESMISLIQNGKKLDIKSPINGLIVEQNTQLLNTAAVINSEPYSEGWMYKIEADNWMEEIQDYFMGDKYLAWIKNELTRLKDFLISGLNPSPETATVLQDGGEIQDGILESLDPRAWEDFQINFLKN